jgi:hypothetical protein
MNDPASFGFDLAVIGVFIWASIDPNRFIKFWIFRPAPYSWSVRLVFRLLFLAVAVGGLWGIAETIYGLKHSISFYLSAMLISVVVFGGTLLWFGVLERHFPRRFGRQPRSRTREP